MSIVTGKRENQTMVMPQFYWYGFRIGHEDSYQQSSQKTKSLTTALVFLDPSTQPSSPSQEHHYGHPLDHSEFHQLQLQEGINLYAIPMSDIPLLFSGYSCIPVLGPSVTEQLIHLSLFWKPHNICNKASSAKQPPY